MVAIKYIGGKPNPVWLPHWEFLGGERLAMDATSQNVTIPQDAQIVSIRAAEGDVHYTFNAISATATSYGFVPQNGGEVVGPLVNLNSLHVYGAAGTFAHVMFYREGRSG